MRFSSTEDEIEGEVNRQGSGCWNIYNDLIDIVTAITGLGIGLFFRLAKYAVVFGLIAFLSIWCGRVAAKWLYEIIISAPAVAYEFFVSIPNIVGVVLHRIARFFTVDIPYLFTVLRAYPLTALLTLAFLHFFLRATFTTSGNNPEPDSTVRGSRIEGNFDELPFTGDDGFSDAEEYQNWGILWLFPGRRWLTSEERQWRWVFFIRCIKAFADGLTNR